MRKNRLHLIKSEVSVDEYEITTCLYIGQQYEIKIFILLLNGKQKETNEHRFDNSIQTGW